MLGEIQKKLKAPKGQKNTFGNYKYRSCEDILEAVKKVLPDEAYLIITDDIVQIGDRFYIKATANLYTGSQHLSASAFAREPLSKKGIDDSQVTGAASSYARKYALNGLFAIDDTKDADTDEVINVAAAQSEKQTKDDKRVAACMWAADQGSVIRSITDKDALLEWEKATQKHMAALEKSHKDLYDTIMEDFNSKLMGLNQ